MACHFKVVMYSLDDTAIARKNKNTEGEIMKKILICFCIDALCRKPVWTRPIKHC
jgi:hypothetical protein